MKRIVFYLCLEVVIAAFYLYPEKRMWLLALLAAACLWSLLPYERGAVTNKRAETVSRLLLFPLGISVSLIRVSSAALIVSLALPIVMYVSDAYAHRKNP